MKRAAVLAVALLIAGAGFVGGRAGLRKLSFFKIRRIELVGARYVTVAQVATALALDPQRPGSVFDDLDHLREKVSGLAGVLEARVSRRIPGTLRVTVREAEPVALAERGDRLVLVDQEGQVLPFDPTRPAADLPLGPADSTTAGVLARIREANPEFFARIERVSRVNRDVALDLGSGRILVRGGAGAEAIQAAVLVADLLDRENKPWRVLDARFLPRIIVRPGGPA